MIGVTIGVTDSGTHSVTSEVRHNVTNSHAGTAQHAAPTVVKAHASKTSALSKTTAPANEAVHQSRHR